MERKMDRIQNYGTYTEKVEKTSIIHKSSDLMHFHEGANSFGVPQAVLKKYEESVPSESKPR
jgi:hypothetical protein